MSDFGPSDSPATRHLHPPARYVLMGWVAIAAVLTIYGFIAAVDIEGWGDLIRVVYIMFFVLAIAILGLTAFVIKRFVPNPTHQVAWALLLPIGLMALLVVLNGV